MTFDAMKHIDLKLIVTTKLYVSNFRAAQIDKKVKKLNNIHIIVDI